MDRAMMQHYSGDIAHARMNVDMGGGVRNLLL
jgi:hypothetical protein